MSKVSKFTKFGYSGYRKDPKILYNSVLITIYPTYWGGHRFTNTALFPPRPEIIISSRLTIFTLTPSFYSTLMLILNILYVQNKTPQSFLTYNFMHMFCSDELDDWII